MKHIKGYQKPSSDYETQKTINDKFKDVKISKKSNAIKNLYQRCKKLVESILK